jgi:hypothetical protein
VQVSIIEGGYPLLLTFSWVHSQKYWLLSTYKLHQLYALHFYTLMFKVSHQFIFRFSLFDQKQKISCPVYLLFTEKEAAVSAQLAVSVCTLKKNQNKDYVIFGDS